METDNTTQNQTASSGNKNMMVIGVIVTVVFFLGGVGFWVMSMNNNPAPAPGAMTNASPATDAGTVGAAKEFTVTAANFSFDPKTINVKVGDKVNITFKNSEGNHDFVIDELNVKTKTLRAGQEAVAEFTATEAGTYEYYCSVGNHRAMGMVGQLVVE